MATKTPLSRLIHEEFESRLLFSAGVETVFIDNNLPDTEPAIVETVTVEEAGILQLDLNQQDSLTLEPVHEVVFIDENVENYAELMADLANKPNTDVFILDTAQDGIEQISAVLANYQGLDAIHLVSHGNTEGLLLGSGNLDSGSIDTYSDAISGWQAALSEDADLLIYGCDVAAGEQGQALLSKLHDLTGTDIAASDDLTGQAAMGGDWVFEYRAGELETSVVFSTQIQSNWQGTLAAPSITGLDGDSQNYLEGDAAIKIDDTATAVSVSDGGVMNDFNPGSLTVSITAGGDAAEDVLGINTSGPISLVGANVRYAGDTIGTVAGGSGGADLVITFTAEANETNVAALIKSITYQNTDTDNPTTGARTIDFTLTNDAPASDIATTTINVIGVNDAPGGTDTTVTTPEDTAHTFTAANFGFSDIDGNALSGVKITTLPASGSLTLNSVAVNAGDTVSAADIAAGKLVFTPLADANGAGYASFTFQVQDDGGVANGGVDLDQTPNTLTIDVTAVNDAPAGTDTTVTTLEDTAHTFSVANFGFSDAVEGDALSGVKITTLPAGGSLTLNSVAVNAGDTVSAADIAAGKLVFTPGADANGTGYASFTFQVQDDGGVANGGVDLDPTPNTLTIDVTAVNDAPAGTDTTVTTLEDTAHTFTAANFGFSDVDGNALSGVKITTLPASGSLTLNSVAVNAGDTVSAADIAAGKLVFTPGADANGAGYASFTFQVQDDGGVANGGVDLDQTPNTLTIDVTAVNDVPTGGVSITGVATENQTLTVDTSALADVDGLGVFSHQWQRDGVDIAGATGSNYTLTNADVGAAITVTTSYTDAQGTPESVTSAGTAPIVNINDVPTGGVTITGTATEGQTLTADTSALADADGLGAISYQWQRDGVNIGGATGNTYTVSSADAGASITVTTSYTDGHGTPESVTSAGASVAGAAPAGSTSPGTNETSDTAFGPVDNTPISTDPNVIDTDTHNDAVSNTPAESQPKTAAVIDIGANGRPTVTSIPGAGELLSALVSHQSSSGAEITTKFLPDDFSAKQNILIESASTSHLNANIMNIDLQKALDELNQRLGSEAHAREFGEQVIVTTMAGVSIALTAGFITWALQGGSLLTALLTTLPVWNTFDPLPILNEKKKKKDKQNKQQHDNVDSVFDEPSSVADA